MLSNFHYLRPNLCKKKGLIDNQSIFSKILFRAAEIRNVGQYLKIVSILVLYSLQIRIIFFVMLPTTPPVSSGQLPSIMFTTGD